MSKHLPSKAKPPPWIPPGKNYHQKSKTVKSQKEKKHEDSTSPKTITASCHHKNMNNQNDELSDSMSLSSNSYDSEHKESNIIILSILQEIKICNVHFASLKRFYLYAHRVVDMQDIEDDNINELLAKIGVLMKYQNDLFDDLEFSVSVLENTLDEEAKNFEYSKVFKCKEKLLSILLEMCEKILVIFQSILEEKDFKELHELQDSLNKKLTASEKKCATQEAIIKDLERRLSIYQGKTSAMESYKTNLENVKAELEKQLSCKESQIKYLNNELLNISVKQEKPDSEGLIEIIEEIKSKAHSDKSALKKALKLQKLQSDQNEEKCQKLLKEFNEKEKMLFDVAAQRDQLKVQLTILSNSLVQQKSQMEELKIQNSKLKKEIEEKELMFKKEKSTIEADLEEKVLQLEKSSKQKQNLEKTIEDLERDLELVRKELKHLKNESPRTGGSRKNSNTGAVVEEMHILIPLLQSTKEMLENFKISHNFASGGGDHPSKDTDWKISQNQILVAINETKEHLIEVKNLFKISFQEEKTKPTNSKRNDLEKQLKKLENLYSTSMKDNEILRSKIEAMSNTSSTQMSENFAAGNTSSDTSIRKLQLELMKKSNEILKMKYQFQQRENDLENLIKEYKDKIKIMEIDNVKFANLEKELNEKKVELSVLQQQKNEEIERLLKRTKELQDALDIKISENEILERFADRLKSSYYRVFQNS